jgi:hypothetical protein
MGTGNGNGYSRNPSLLQSPARLSDILEDSESRLIASLDRSVKFFSEVHRVLGKRLGSWVDSIRDQTALPLRLELWNGKTVDFERHAPKVTIRVPKVSALSYLLQPSLFNLGKAYVAGEIGVEGRANEIISVAMRLPAIP